MSAQNKASPQFESQSITGIDLKNNPMAATRWTPFDQFGHVPDNYIQVTSTVSSHV